MRIRRYFLFGEGFRVDFVAATRVLWTRSENICAAISKRFAVRSLRSGRDNKKEESFKQANWDLLQGVPDPRHGLFHVYKAVKGAQPDVTLPSGPGFSAQGVMNVAVSICDDRHGVSPEPASAWIGLRSKIIPGHSCPGYATGSTRSTVRTLFTSLLARAAPSCRSSPLWSAAFPEGSR